MILPCHAVCIIVMLDGSHSSELNEARLSLGVCDKYVQHVGETTITIILNDPLDLEEGLCKRVKMGGGLKEG
jgi:hypothetical protein